MTIVSVTIADYRKFGHTYHIIAGKFGGEKQICSYQLASLANGQIQPMR